jgi:hypothetical protein
MAIVKGIAAGAQFAGQFEGNLAISGTLAVNGRDLVQEVTALQAQGGELQRQLQSLLARLEAMQPASGYLGGGGTPFLSALSTGQYVPGVSRQLFLSGSGFTPHGRVRVRVVGAGGFSTQAAVAADANGYIPTPFSFDVNTTVAPLFVAATDERANPQDLTGLLWSNTLSVSNRLSVSDR